jgi:hypothetical protein
MVDPQLLDAREHLAQAETAPSAGAAPSADAPANRPPTAGDVCVQTAEGSAISIPVLQYDHDPDGDPLRLLAASQPVSGQVALNPDGTVTFTPVQAGLQSFRYEVDDGHGGHADAAVSAFVNPTTSELQRPVLEGLDDQQLAKIAHACAAGMALDVAKLSGPDVRIDDPVPGQRIQVQAEAGQHIALASQDFASATYLVVDGGLLVITPDGNMAYVAGFVDAARGHMPPTLSVSDGPAVASDQLLASLQPFAVPADGGEIGRIVLAAGPQHGGGAGFHPYTPGDIGPGLNPLGPQGPTEFGRGGEFLLQDKPLPGLAEQVPFVGGEHPPTSENQAPTFSSSGPVERESGEVTTTPQFESAGPFPHLGETVRLPDAQINGVDQHNLTLGQNGDAAIVFDSEFASFVNTLGVFLIDPNGQIVDPKIVFPQIEQAQFDPSFPLVHPGGGPLSEGDQVLLSQLYDPSQLHPGQEFGLFMIAQGYTLNGNLSGADLVFQSDGRTATIFDPTPQLLTADGQKIAGSVFFTADPTQDSPNVNPLNPDGLGHVVSGLQPDHSGLTIGFEDKLLSGGGDNDFNDVLIDVGPGTSGTTFIPGAVHVTLSDATITDRDDTNLSRASVALDPAHSQPGDALAFHGSLANTGVDLVTNTPSSLVFEGTASIQAYEQILRSVALDAAPVEGLRQIDVTLVDQHGSASSPFVVSADLSGTATEVGTAGNDTLIGQPLVDDTISGLDGNDILFGDSGNDKLDGGPGNDILGGSVGNDTLNGGPGADSFVYSSPSQSGDQITGFNANQGDRLDFSQLLQGATASNIDNFVQFTPAAGSNVAVSVDADGPGSNFAPAHFLTLVDPTGVATGDGAAQAAVNNGALVV